MPVMHVREFGAENPSQKTGAINRHENRALTYSLPKTGKRKTRCQIAWQTDVPETSPVFW